MVKIIGVDFSGGDETQGVNTWITEGQLVGSKLNIICCRRIKRDDLTKFLRCQPKDTVAALDFPFSVPLDFATLWKQKARKMPDLWRAAAKTRSFQDFKGKCDDYAKMKKKGEKHPLRIGDLYSNKPLSCLNTRMRRMTFYGMQMLHRIWESKSCVRVPPLDDSGRNGPVLLEVMPGVALESFRLLCEPYKEAAKRSNKLKIKNNREKILQGLAIKSKVEMPNLGEFCGKYLNSHDALDSLVAAVVAARWVLYKQPFHHPTAARTDCKKLPDPRRCHRASKKALDMPQVQAARLEGWIYAPRPS